MNDAWQSYVAPQTFDVYQICDETAIKRIKAASNTAEILMKSWLTSNTGLNIGVAPVSVEIAPLPLPWSVIVIILLPVSNHNPTIAIPDRHILAPPSVTSTAPQIREAPPEIFQFARPKQTESDDNECEWQCDGPEDPLIYIHVADVIRVHAQDAGDSAEGEEDNGHDGEGIDGRFLTVFVEAYFFDVLGIHT